MTLPILLRRIRLPALLALAAAAGAWLVTPGPSRHADFDPAEVARAETGLWRHYYERRHAALAAALATNGYRMFGLSPWDSVRAGVNAALAARRFQDSRSRDQAGAALQPLTRHFTIIRQAMTADFDPAEAARLELDWWQLRRESDSGPAAYAPAIATATAHRYGVGADGLARYAQLRAEAMHLRDRRGSSIDDADWQRIETLLTAAYNALKGALVRS